MKLALFSDLHLPHWRNIEYSSALMKLADHCSEADVVCNAGDNSEAPAPFNLKKYFPNQVYLEIPGNHDYYRGTFKNEFYTKEIDGLKFFVGTLWSNFNENPLAEMVAKRSINDFLFIKNFDVETCKKAYYETRQALEDYRPHIVMTHFAPFHQSIHPKYGDTPLNYYFCNNMKDIFEHQPQIKLWLFGHSHMSADYTMNKELCRVVSHPLGYPGENTFNFSDYQPKMIEI